MLVMDGFLRRGLESHVGCNVPNASTASATLSKPTSPLTAIVILYCYSLSNAVSINAMRLL